MIGFKNICKTNRFARIFGSFHMPGMAKPDRKAKEAKLFFMVFCFLPSEPLKKQKLPLLFGYFLHYV